MANNNRVAILVFPFASAVPFSIAKKLLRVVSDVTEQTFFISGGIPDHMTFPENVQPIDIGIRLHYLKDKQPVWASTLLWIFRFILVQVAMGREIYRHRKEIDVVICYLGYHYLLPILAGRLLHKKVVLASLADGVRLAQVNYGSRLWVWGTDLLVRLQYALVNNILVDSLCLFETRDSLKPFRSKAVEGALFIDDLERFSIYPDARREGNLIGFAGRISIEKGIRELVQAIPLALSKQFGLQFLIIGRGRLDEEITMKIQTQPWADRVRLIKWVDHEEMPAYLNRMDLLVMPSYTEGLPNLALEAMACGTPLLATGVGVLPDLITENETGFLLQDNSPETIAEAMVRAINDPELANISLRARELIESNYSLEASTERYQILMASLFR